MLLIFIVGYILIAFEHKIKIDKAAIALLMCGTIWTIFSLLGIDPNIKSELVEHLGDTCEILVFLIGAMTIVNIIDSYDGFSIITKFITIRNKRKLLWLLSFLTFFMSATLDNMTTAIIMIVLINRLIKDDQERWMYAGIVIIAANSGGAWSPIGDVTTIMLWMRGNVTALPLVQNLLLPCLVSMIIPTLLATKVIKNEDIVYSDEDNAENITTPLKYRKRILLIGVISLLFVPVFKSITHLPPYMGMMISLGLMWIASEGIYDKKRALEGVIKNRITKVLKNVDLSTILFFLGVLMSVAALQTAGILNSVSIFLDKNIHEVFSITGIIGVLSSVVDNVPLVAACMGMYPTATPEMVSAAASPEYTQAFVQDGMFWHLLTYCAGVGGSIMIIGSAAGVVTMGLENINFGWYLKNISLLAFIGYVSGMLVIFLEHTIVGI